MQTITGNQNTDNKIVRVLTIINEKGMHARASAKFVEVTDRFSADVEVEKDDTVVPGNSIMGLLLLAAAKGSKITVRAQGKDAEAALDALEHLLGSRFDEPF